MKRHPESHVDHVPPSVLAFVLEKYADREDAAVFVETFDLPADLPPLDFALYGPVVGDDPIHDRDVSMEARGARKHPSRMIDKPARLTRTCTVVGGPVPGAGCVLYTVYGGPVAPKEPADPYLKPEERAASEEFWARHALAKRSVS